MEKQDALDTIRCGSEFGCPDMAFDADSRYWGYVGTSNWRHAHPPHGKGKYRDVSDSELHPGESFTLGWHHHRMGKFATEMAASYPDRVDKLVLVGCPVRSPLTGTQRLRESTGDYDEDSQPKPRTSEELKARSTFVDPRQEWVDATNETRAQAGVWVQKLSHSLAHYDIRARLPMIQSRATLVMYGEHDRLREGEDLLYNNIANASKAILPGLGHIPQIEDPEVFVDTLLTFLKS